MGRRTDNSFVSGDYTIRFLLPARMVGSIVGRGGDIIRGIREATQSNIDINYKEYDERVLIISNSDKDKLLDTVDRVAKAVWDEFKGLGRGQPEHKKPPMVLVGPQNRENHDEHIQFCMILANNEVKKVKKRLNDTSPLKELTEIDGFVHHRYNSGEFLPHSQDKIFTLTGEPANMQAGVNHVVTILEEDSLQSTNGFDVRRCGVTGFFGGQATWKGAAQPVMPQAGGPVDNSSMGMPSNRFDFGAMSGPPKMIPGLDPFVQKLCPVKQPNGTYVCTITKDQVPIVLGRGGTRINAIQTLSGAIVDIEKPDASKCTREVVVKNNPEIENFTHVEGYAYKKELALKNALWLIQVCINAYVPQEFTIYPFDESVSLEFIMASKMYGTPPTEEQVRAEMGPQGGVTNLMSWAGQNQNQVNPVQNNSWNANPAQAQPYYG